MESLVPIASLLRNRLASNDNCSNELGTPLDVAGHAILNNHLN
jgi:hypothetical protein